MGPFPAFDFMARTQFSSLDSLVIDFNRCSNTVSRGHSVGRERTCQAHPPTHIYRAPGLYTVLLIKADNDYFLCQQQVSSALDRPPAQ